jgi:16S rRNA (uracil1498-N3)-methyltransferase
LSPPLFLVDEIPDKPVFRLDGPEGHHAAAVQRLRPGEQLTLCDGRGGTAGAMVTASLRDALDVEIVRRGYEEPADPRLTVVQGIAKGDRAELAVATMTEVGVDTVVPWAAARSIARWRDERPVHRWRATARESAKQSRRAWVPEITPPQRTAGVAARIGGAAAAYVLHEEAVDRLAAVSPPTAGEIVLVVGPEGGVDESELAVFTAAGAVPVRLGRTVLRTSTAGAAALAVLAVRLGRW